MTTSARQAAAGIATGVGAVLLAIGLILGFGGITKGGVSCGSAFKPDDHAAKVSDLTNAMTGYGDTGSAGSCADATGSRKTIAWALTAPGGVLLLAGGLTLLADAQSRRESAASPA